MSCASNKGDTAGVASLIQKSKDNWDLSYQLRCQRMYDAAANRLYYSLFQAVKAYAVKTGKTTIEEEVGVHGKLKGIVRDEDANHGDIFDDAMQMRVKADYLAEHVVESELDRDFIYNAEMVRTHYESLAER